MKQTGEPLPSLDVVLSETKVALDRQFEQISSLDMKLGVLLGLSAVILAALLAFPLIRNGNMTTKWLLIAAVVLILVSLFSATWGYRISKYKGPPAPEVLRESYLMREPEKTKLAVVDYLCSAYDWNQKLLANIIKCFRISFGCAFLGILIIGGTILYNLL